MKRNLQIFCVLLALALSTLACSTNGFSFGKNGATITINLNEDQVNKMLAESTNHIESADRLLNTITSLDFQDGKIRVFGTYTLANGREKIGSFDVTLGEKDGTLESQIVAVDIEGMSLDDPKIARMNQEMSVGLSEMTSQSNGEVIFKSAKVTDDGLQLVVQLVPQTK